MRFAPTAPNARLDPHIEAVAYFCVVEWVRGLAQIRVEVDLPPEWLVLTMLAAGSGPLRRVDHQPIIDRVEGCGGEVSLEADADGRPHLRARLPASSRVIKPRVIKPRVIKDCPRGKEACTPQGAASERSCTSS